MKDGRSEFFSIFEQDPAAPAGDDGLAEKRARESLSEAFLGENSESVKRFMPLALTDAFAHGYPAGESGFAELMSADSCSTEALLRHSTSNEEHALLCLLYHVKLLRKCGLQYSDVRSGALRLAGTDPKSVLDELTAREALVTRSVASMHQRGLTRHVNMLLAYVLRVHMQVRAGMEPGGAFVRTDVMSLAIKDVVSPNSKTLCAKLLATVCYMRNNAPKRVDERRCKLLQELLGRTSEINDGQTYPLCGCGVTSLCIPYRNEDACSQVYLCPMYYLKLMRSCRFIHYI